MDYQPAQAHIFHQYQRTKFHPKSRLNPLYPVHYSSFRQASPGFSPGPNSFQIHSFQLSLCLPVHFLSSPLRLFFFPYSGSCLKEELPRGFREFLSYTEPLAGKRPHHLHLSSEDNRIYRPAALTISDYSDPSQAPYKIPDYHTQLPDSFPFPRKPHQQQTGHSPLKGTCCIVQTKNIVQHPYRLIFVFLPLPFLLTRVLSSVKTK